MRRFLLAIFLVSTVQPIYGGDTNAGAAREIILRVQLQAIPSQSPNLADQLQVRILEGGDLDGFALISEPSHTLLAYVLNSDRDTSRLEGSDWYASEVAPFLDQVTPIKTKRSPMRMITPIHDGSTVGFGSLDRSSADDAVIFSALGDGLIPWRGSRMERVTLARGGRRLLTDTGWTQTFALLGSGYSPNSSFICGCGDHQAPPCGTGNGTCSACITCPGKPGAFCNCCLETTLECGWCGNSYATCGAPCPFC